MKYIRTKDNLIGEYWEIASKKDSFIIRVPHKFPTELCKDKIFKVADTIEELCDLYVIWLKNRELPLIEKIRKGYKPHLSYFETSECSFDKGYGAIWTDKGLIYVAKMNEKGELELL